MFSTGAAPGEMGMQQAGWQPGGSLDAYKATEPYTPPEGCYSDLSRCPPCEMRVGHNGRGIWTRPSLPDQFIPRPGATMLRLVPHVTALSTQYLTSHCSGCHEEQKSNKPLLRCQRCKIVCYCDQACQKSDWPLHKFECPALVAHAEKRGTTSESDEGSSEGTVGTVFVPSETVRALGRLVWLHSREKSNSVKAGFGKRYRGSIIEANAHTLSTPSLTPIGVALSPVAALINHSCVPNCVVVFPKASETKKVPNEMLIIAIGKILPGEEVQIPHTLGKFADNKILQERYFFKCHCPNCEMTSLVKTPYVDSRRAFRCASKTCEGFLPMPSMQSQLGQKQRFNVYSAISCALSNPRRSQMQSDSEKKGSKGRRNFNSLVSYFRSPGLTYHQSLTLCAGLLDPERAFKYTSNLIPMVSRFFHPSAHPLLALSRLHLSLLISRLDLDRSILDEAIRAAARVAAGISAVLPAGHPVRAVTYAELGKLLAVDEYYPEGQEPPEPTSAQLDPKANLTWVAGDEMGIPKGFERLRLAHHTLMQARQELLIGFGHSEEGGAVGKEVTELARKIEQEVAIWRKAGGGKRPVSIS
ncbi:zf-MYND domain-containing protein [Rhizoctonia solani AG-1 IA]|uniref:Zf-MYND domain-containing protein n=1 Tax=Thanatephorus cucumeris (strain AG1-IA) TaxID=983506 RepID=L8X7T7_THACA|nr:zf-MYND domain-containing protein [Rhizoctonia solani AG-1 IA]